MEAEKTETCLIFFNTQILQNKVIPKLSWRETARETKKNGKNRRVSLRKLAHFEVEKRVVEEAKNTLFSGCPLSSRPP